MNQVTAEENSKKDNRENEKDKPEIVIVISQVEPKVCSHQLYRNSAEYKHNGQICVKPGAHI